MHSHYHQEACAGLLVESGKIGGIQLLWVPCVQHILVSHFRRVSVSSQMILVGIVFLLI